MYVAFTLCCTKQYFAKKIRNYVDFELLKNSGKIEEEVNQEKALLINKNLQIVFHHRCMEYQQWSPPISGGKIANFALISFRGSDDLLYFF